MTKPLWVLLHPRKAARLIDEADIRFHISSLVVRVEPGGTPDIQTDADGWTTRDFSPEELDNS